MRFFVPSLTVPSPTVARSAGFAALVALVGLAGCPSASEPDPTPAPTPALDSFAADPERPVPADVRDGPCMDVTLADLDADGDLDVVIANEGPRNRVLWNEDGTLRSGPETPRPQTDSEEAWVGDLDGDGVLDALFADEDTIDDEWYRWVDGAFADRSDDLPPSDTSNALDVADLDGDGWLDVVMGNGGPNTLWRGSPQGFMVADDVPVRDETTQDIAIADLNGDGLLDVWSANEGPDAIWLQDADGSFVDGTAGLPGANVESRQVALADLDGDGDVDALQGNVGWSGLSRRDRLLLNDGAGTFTVATDALPDDQHHTLDVLLVDLDGDGDLDVIRSTVSVGNQGLGASPYTAWENDGGEFTDVTERWLPGAPEGMGLDAEVGDLDGDGLLDLYLCSRGGDDQVLYGQGG